MSVSIIMPCYNESEVIENVVRKYYETIISKIEGSELIVIDDCSNDITPTILRRLQSELTALRVLRRPVNGGYGKAVLTGYEAAVKEWIFLVDSDNQFDPRDFWSLYALKDGSNFILGFRRERKDPLHRLFLSGMLRLVNFALWGVWIRDVNCPFRLMERELVTRCLNYIDKESLIPNILISVLAKKSCAFVEAPVTHSGRKTGVVSIRKWKLIKFAVCGFIQMVIFRIQIILNRSKI